MNKTAFIDSQIQELEELIKKVEKKQDRKEILSFVGGLGFLSFGVLSVFSGLGFVLGGIILGSGLFAMKDYIAKNTKQKISDLNEEKQHLENVKKNGIDGSKDLNIKRKNKIKVLEKKEEELKSKKTGLSIVNTATRVGTAVGAFLTMTAPGLFFIPLIGVGAELVMSKLKQSNDKALGKTTTRINNLANDLEIIKLAQGNKTTSKNSKKTKTIPQKTPTKTKSKSGFLSEEDEALVDKIIEEMSSETAKEIPKQNVKK